ncbi:MAG: 5-formyltetrahydrofolate cyclo-ligase [Spirosomataceae bacterium]
MKNTKGFFRAYFLEQRRLLIGNEVQQKSEQIAMLISQLFAQHGSRVIHCFLPIRERAEVDTLGIISRAKAEGIQVLIPKVNTKTQEIDSCLWEKETTLVLSKWGVLEPQDAVPFEQLEQIDCVVTPLLAYDSLGYRVGYGKGFYDRFFGRCRADVLKAGVSFFEPVDIITDSEPHDVRLDYCITPTQIWDFTQQNR